MSIKFQCPHCQKPLNVKDELAGKRAKCPACKQVLSIPAPTAAPANVEDFAAATLKDPPPAAAAPQHAKTVDFNCPQCDTELHLGAELEGKQHPCPECGRIIKVPLLVKREPTDWRKADVKLPAGARRDAEPAPEGAWGSTISTSTVSRQSLVEADAIPAVRARWTAGQWAVRGVAVAAVLAVVAVSVFYGMGWWARYRQNQALDRALKMVSTTPGKPTISREADAEIQRAAGEFRLRSRQNDCATDTEPPDGSRRGARTHFQAARSLLATGPASTERDLLLIELALAQVELGGSGSEVEKGMRLPWEEVQKELRQTLQNLSMGGSSKTSREAQVEALRSVSHQLVGKGQEGVTLARALATLLSAAQGRIPVPDQAAVPIPVEVPEGMAVVGLELVRTDRKSAELLADGALAMYPVGDQEGIQRPRLAPSLAALCVALGKPEPDPGKDNEEDQDALLLGRCEAMARQGDLTKAREMAGTARPLLRLQAQVTLAAVAVHSGSSDMADLNAAIDLAGELKGRVEVSPWLLVRLVQLGGRARLPSERLQPIADGIQQDPALRGRAQLEILRARLGAMNGKAEDAWADAMDKQTISHALAREALARHNVRFDSGTMKTVDGWEERLRPFGYVGIALGLQDGSR